MIDIYTINLLDILPDSLKNDPDVRAIAEAISPELQEISTAIANYLNLSQTDTLPEEVIDLLAWESHVDFYDSSLTLEQKRQMVDNSTSWHRRKGTPSAVEELITTIFGEGKVEEWFEYDGQPYRFRVITNNESATNEKAAEFIRALNSVKNERSWLDKIVIGMNEPMDMHFAGVLHMGDNLTVKQVV